MLVEVRYRGYFSGEQHAKESNFKSCIARLLERDLGLETLGVFAGGSILVIYRLRLTKLISQIELNQCEEVYPASVIEMWATNQ